MATIIFDDQDEWCDHKSVTKFIRAQNMNDDMKLRFFFENFDKIKLEDLEKLIK